MQRAADSLSFTLGQMPSASCDPTAIRIATHAARRRAKALFAWALELMVGVTLTGCCGARPTVPASTIKPTICESPRAHQQPVNLIDLRLNRPVEYRVGPGDVLAVYVEGLPGGREAFPSVNIPQQASVLPSAGAPAPVNEDGTIALPLVGSIMVQGMTLPEVRERVRQAYVVDRELLPAKTHFAVSLFRRRTYNVLVIREDRNPPLPPYTPGQVVVEPSKTGFSQSLELPAYENDVLHALVATGGLPGVTAKNEVVVLRGAVRDPAEAKKLLVQLEDPQQRGQTIAQLPAVTVIPFRVPEGCDPPQLNPQDIILGDGDVVLIESRAASVFYTGGTLKGGQFQLPRDYDLDVLGAIAMAGGSVGTAAGGTATSAGVVVARGGGAFPPTRITVVRFQNGCQKAIRVDLNTALTNPRERILIQPNDLILLEYTPLEFLGNLILNEVFVSITFNKNL